MLFVRFLGKLSKKKFLKLFYKRFRRHSIETDEEFAIAVEYTKEFHLYPLDKNPQKNFAEILIEFLNSHTFDPVNAIKVQRLLSGVVELYTELDTEGNLTDCEVNIDNQNIMYANEAAMSAQKFSSISINQVAVYSKGRFTIILSSSTGNNGMQVN